MSSPNPTQPEEEYGADIGADMAYAQMEEEALREQETL